MFRSDMDPITGDPTPASFDEQREAAADVLDTVADEVEAQAARVNSGVVREFSTKARRKIGAAASYVREHDANDMLNDVRRIAVANPMPVLIGAVAVGFLAGRIIRRH